MKIPIKQMNWFVRLITFNWPDAITLAPKAVYIKNKYFNDVTCRNHESIHWYQQLEVYSIGVILSAIIQVVLLLNGIFLWWILLILLFPPTFYYLWYFIECLIRIPINGKKAYKLLLFEQEAYSNEDNLNYLNERNWFTWLI